MEIVSEPDLRSRRGGRALSAQAALDPALSRHLRRQHGGGLAALRLQRLGAPAGRALGTRCEIKNVNSVRFVEQAIEYEARRQIELIEEGGTVEQQTRLFDAGRGVTRPMRSKEARARLPLFPRSRSVAAGARPGMGRAAARRTAGTAGREEGALRRASTGSRRMMPACWSPRSATADYSTNGCAKGARPEGGGELGHRRSVRRAEPARLGIERIAGRGRTLGRADRPDRRRHDLRPHRQGRVRRDGRDRQAAPAAIVEAKGLRQVSDAGAIEAAIDAVLAASPAKVAEYRAGNDKLSASSSARSCGRPAAKPTRRW